MLRKTEFNPEFNLHSLAEEIYFWLMRSTSDPKAHAKTFQVLSQIMRIASLSSHGGDYIPKAVEASTFAALFNIKEQLHDGKMPISKLFDAVLQVLRKLTYENPKAQLIAHATEIEYIFCIHSTYNSTTEADYQQKFKGYLKTLVNTVNSSLSSTQAKAIVQILSQIVRNPAIFSEDPHKILSESLQKSGITVVNPPEQESETA